MIIRQRLRLKKKQMEEKSMSCEENRECLVKNKRERGKSPVVSEEIREKVLIRRTWGSSTWWR